MLFLSPPPRPPLSAPMSDSGSDDDEELKALRLLQEKASIYGWEVDDPKYKKKLKEIYNKHSGKKKAPGDEADVMYKGYEWRDWADYGIVNASSFAQVASKIEGDSHTGPSRGGLTSYNGKQGLTWRRRVAVCGQWEKHYRMVEIDPGKKYVVQELVPIAKVDEVDEDDEEPPLKKPKKSTGAASSGAAPAQPKAGKKTAASTVKPKGKGKQIPAVAEEPTSPRQSVRERRPVKK